MIQRLRGNKGFTLIELMIVVAIIGILAAIAIPNFVSMQLRSKRAELPTNLDGIRTAEKAYEAEWDSFTAAAASPSSIPGKSQVSFGHTFGDGSDWDLLGWLADGQVRGQYEVVTTGGTSAASANFSASARADVDGDNVTSAYGCDRNVKPQMITQNSIY